MNHWKQDVIFCVSAIHLLSRDISNTLSGPNLYFVSSENTILTVACEH